MERINGQNLSSRAVPPSTERKRKRLTSASSASCQRIRRTRRESTVRDYVGSDRLYWNTALRMTADLIEADSIYFKAASRQFEDTKLKLMRLGAHTFDHGELVELVTEE